MKTKQRIVLTSLELFNIHGEPNVTTVDIAHEMDISPGNLYYHYRNKDEIISVLIDEFEQEISTAFAQVDAYLLGIEELWEVAKLILEKIWLYRFLYRDINNLISKQHKFSRQMQRLIKRQDSTIETTLLTLREGNVLRATDRQLELVTSQVSLTLVFWLNFNQLMNKPRTSEQKQQATPEMDQGVEQVIALVTPYLRPTYRTMVTDYSNYLVQSY